MSKIQKSNGQTKRLGLMSLLLASSALPAVTPAFAQEAAGGLDEIVVTAQKRTENLQDVPIAVTAFGAESLEQLHITDFDDYALMLPSVSFAANGQGPGFNRVFFRGVASGENGNHSTSLPSVGTYLDEQPITTITGNLDVHLYDINRVEALAGPQGTLYGASSEAGTIRIITNQPDLAGVSAAYNVEYNTIDHGDAGEVVEGYLNVPVASNAAIRIVGWQEHAGGYIDNVPGSVTFPTAGISMDNASAVQNDYNDVDTWGARAALRVELDDNWTITPSIMGQQSQSNGVFAQDTRLGDLEISHFFPETSEDEWIQAALTIEGRIANLDVTYAGSYLDRQVDYQQDYTDYAYFYDALRGYYFLDDGGDYINPAQYIQARDGYLKQSHELRFASPSENRLRFVGGLFYQRQYHQITQRYFVNGDLGAAYESNGLTDTIWLTEQNRIDRDWAVFGEVSYDLTPQLTITGGLRLFKYDNSLFGFFGFSPGFSSNPIYACTDPTPLRQALCSNLDKSQEDEGHTERVNLTYRINDDVLVYGTYSTGFRPGGVNRRGSLPPYDADFLTNYELGWKSTILDNHLRFNGAVFFEQWEDFQYSILGQSGLSQVVNAGNADIYGIEASVDWAVTDSFTLSGAATYLHSETTTDLCNIDDATGLTDCSLPLEAPSGTELPVTPDFKANLTGRYEFVLGGLDSFAQLSGVYQSEVFNDLRVSGENERALIGNSDAFFTADFSTGIDMPTWSLSMYVSNLTDERGETARYAECMTNVCAANDPLVPNGGGVYAVVIQPRTFGIRFGQRF